MVRVLGITSLAKGSPYSLKKSNHVFMFDFDEVQFRDFLEEAIRLHEKWNIDLFLLQSSIDGFHILSFDIMPSRLVQSIQADVRLDSDYPLISERIVDKFLTLRISSKCKKGRPRFIGRLVKPNLYKKSKAHIDYYCALCGVLIPSFYCKKNMIEEVLPYLASYSSLHRLK